VFNKINALVLKHFTIKSLLNLKQEVKYEHKEIFHEIITILDKNEESMEKTTQLMIACALKLVRNMVYFTFKDVFFIQI
jgi:hypothetical protein